MYPTIHTHTHAHTGGSHFNKLRTLEIHAVSSVVSPLSSINELILFCLFFSFLGGVEEPKFSRQDDIPHKEAVLAGMAMVMVLSIKHMELYYPEHGLILLFDKVHFYFGIEFLKDELVRSWACPLHFYTNDRSTVKPECYFVPSKVSLYSFVLNHSYLLKQQPYKKGNLTNGIGSSWLGSGSVSYLPCLPVAWMFEARAVCELNAYG